MEINIDPNVNFTLRGGEIKIRVDALDLEELYMQLWKDDAQVRKDESGSPILNEEGKEVLVLPYKVLEEKLMEFLKKTNPDAAKLTRSELQGIWAHAPTAWAKKNEIWQKPGDDSPTSPPVTDLRQAD